MTRVGTVLPGVLSGLLPEAVTARRTNWIEVARKDVADARRSWVFSALGGSFATLVLLAGMAPALLYPGPSDFSFYYAIGFIYLHIIRWFVPLLGLVIGVLAVVSERESGSLHVLLGLPITRRDVVVGELLGRIVVSSVILIIGLSFAGLISWYLYPGFDLLRFAHFVANSLLLGWIFVGVGVGFSALFRSRGRAVGASVAVFALVGLVWHVVPDGVYYLARGQFPENVPPPWEPPGWFVFLGNVNPVNGVYAILREWLRVNIPGGMLQYRGYGIEGPGPFYLQPEFLLVVVLLWALVPLVLGAWRFGRSDLG